MLLHKSQRCLKSLIHPKQKLHDIHTAALSSACSNAFRGSFSPQVVTKVHNKSTQTHTMFAHTNSITLITNLLIPHITKSSTTATTAAEMLLRQQNANKYSLNN